MGELSNNDTCLDLRILDLSDEKGMFCSKLLGDMGADVIRVEKPGGGSERNCGPFLDNMSDPERSLHFWYGNTSKRGITLDIERKDGQHVLRELAAHADVIVETFSPGYLAERELDYEALSQLNPRLIVTSITAFGQTGPYRNYKSCDLVASALGGQMYVCGEAQGPPLRPYGEQSYLTASLFGAIGTMLAVQQRHITGKGQWVDISMQECVAAVVEPVNVRYLYEGIITKRQGARHWSDAFRIFPCQDGYILISLFRRWDTLVEWLDSEGMANDLKDGVWRDEDIRRRRIDHVAEIIERWTQTHCVEELVEQAQLMRLPWASVNSPGELLENPQIVERGFFTKVEHPELNRSFKYPGSPYKFSRTPWRISRRAPLIGEHNKEVICDELELNDDYP